MLSDARAVIALLLAPATIPVVTLVAYLVPWIAQRGARGPLPSLIRASLSFAIVVTVIGYVTVALLGIPVSLWLLRSGRLTRRRLVAVGAILGALPVLLLAVRAAAMGIDTSPDDLRTSLLLGLLGIGYGAATGGVAALMMWPPRRFARSEREG